MTIWDLMATLWRRRVTTLVCLTLSAVALLLVAGDHRVYNGHVAVLLLSPDQESGNALSSTTDSLIAMAGVVSRAANGAQDRPLTVSSDLTVASLGTTVGWSIRQPTVGGQWEVRFEDPLVDIRSTGPTLEVAQEQMALALARAQEALTGLQDQENVPQDVRIRTELSPAQPTYTVQSGSRIRALAITALACAIGTGLVVAAVDAARPRERRRSPRARARGRRPAASPPRA